MTDALMTRSEPTSDRKDTVGRLFVPASTSPAVDVSLNGTWQFTNGDIDLTSSSDTFLRDMLFTVSGNTLVGDQTFGATRIQVVLTKL